MERMVDYTPYEMIAYIGSRLLEDKKTVFVGTGLPMISTIHAQRTHAPNIIQLFEAGSLNPILELGLPISVGDTRVGVKSCLIKGLCTAFELSQRGFVDYGFIGGAEIDQYGNVNATMIGEDYSQPTTRFPGSGGAGHMAANCERVIIIVPLERRRFRKKIHFVTNIGYGDGSVDYRRRAGVLGSGPWRVITHMAVFGFDEATKKMMLLEAAPGYTINDILERMEFKPIIPDEGVKMMTEPTTEDIKILKEIDPEGLFLARKIIE
jgi:glutaconate CoA-transferase subunit B